MASVFTHNGKVLTNGTSSFNLNNLVEDANEVTGAEDVTITDAVQSLIDGYGSGESFNIHNLTAVLAADDSDELAIYDVSANDHKKITKSDFIDADTTPTAGSSKLITSGAVATAITNALNDTVKYMGAITSFTDLATINAGFYSVDNVSNSSFPTTDKYFGGLICLNGTYKGQILVAGATGVSGLFARRYLTGSSSWAPWKSIDSGGGGSSAASDITITDTGSYFTSDNVEGALQELGEDIAVSDEVDEVTIDTVPTSGSSNPISSGGVANALDDKQDVLISSGASVGQYAKIASVDASGKPTSWEPASGGGGSSAASGITITDTGSYYTSGNVEGALQEIGEVVSDSDEIYEVELDDTPTSGSDNPVTSSGIKLALDTKADLPTIVSEGTSITLADNTEYRLGSAASISIAFPATMPQSLDVWISFSSGATATTITYPTGIKWSGDSISEGEFVPVANKLYNIAMWWDGTNMNGIVRGV